MSQLNKETFSSDTKKNLPDGYLETLDLFLENKDKLMNFSVEEPNIFEVNVYCRYHYLVENNFEELKADAILKVKNLELLAMIQHFVCNIDLEDSTFSKTKKGIFFILESTDEHIIPIFIDDMNMKFKLTIDGTNITFKYEDFI